MTTSREAPVRVIVSDSTHMECEVLSFALHKRRERFQVVGAYSTARELVDCCRKTSADVVLVSINLSDGPTAGLASVRAIHDNNPELAIVVMMNVKTRDTLIDAFRAGARGVLYRTESFDTLCKCLDVVHKGQLWAATNELDEVLLELRHTVPISIVGADGSKLLTTRQHQLVALVSGGLTNREIASELHLTEHTVKNYLFRIFDKLGVSSRAELIIYAMNNQNHGSSN